MTTNSPNPVDGDVQALTDKERIKQFDVVSSLIEKIVSDCANGWTAERDYLLPLQIALAALTAEPVAYTDAEELETLRNGTFADMFTPHDSYKADSEWIALYTTPPAQLLRPLELPDEAPNALVALCQQMYDHKSTGSSVAHDVWQDCLEELRLNATAQPVTDGCKVPNEPTPEMQTAGATAIRFDTTPVNKLFTANAVYRAMLAAAPGGQDG